MCHIADNNDWRIGHFDLSDSQIFVIRIWPHESGKSEGRIDLIRYFSPRFIFYESQMNRTNQANIMNT